MDKKTMTTVINTIRKETMSPVIRLSRSFRPVYPTQTKLFGCGYLPDGNMHPMDANDKPLCFLCQINFDELPKLTGFPDHGLLQFYISPLQPDWGMNIGNKMDNRYFRVLYHDAPLDCKKLPSGNNGSIFLDVQIPLYGTLAEEPMSMDDFRFPERFYDICKQKTGKQMVTLLDLRSMKDTEMYDKLLYPSHRIGGSPNLVDHDYRSYALKEHTVLLLQICCEPLDKERMWVHGGSICFFIRPADLAKLDFSQVAMAVDRFELEHIALPNYPV